MRKPIAVAGICLAACFVMAAGDARPLNVKTGLWQMTEVVTWTGLPPQYASMMKSGQPIKYKSCVKEKDLSSNPWTNEREKCAWTALKSSSTDMEIETKACQMGEFGTADIHGTIHASDTENGTGSLSIVMTMNGQTLKGHVDYTGKWLAADCSGVD